MSLIFITGVAASGKSTITTELRNRGHIAYDTDDNALARWQNDATGYIYPKSSVKAADRTKDFLDNHSWNVPRESLESILMESDGRTVYICGVANNIDQLRDLFSEVYALIIDEETLKDRIINRTNNDWGKQPHELAQSLGILKDATSNYKREGYILVDATKSLNAVIADILKSSPICY